jgi:phage-related protein
MKIANSILVLLSLSFLSEVFALEKLKGLTTRAAETSDSQRKLQTLFDDMDCRSELRRCYVNNGPDYAPFDKWSSLIDNVQGDPMGVLDTTRYILDQSGLVNFTAFYEGIAVVTNAQEIAATTKDIMANFTQLGDLRGHPQSAEMIVNAALKHISDLVGAVFELIYNIIVAIVRVVLFVLNLIHDVVHAVLDIVVNIIEAVWKFIVELLNGIHRAFDLHAKGLKIGSLCQVELTSCQYEDLVLTTVPNLISMSYLVAGTTQAVTGAAAP